MEKLTRGKLAKSSGVHPETIRYYEQNGLIPVPARSESNYRLFDQDSVERVHFIKRAQSVGFSLDEIRLLLSLKYAVDATCEPVRQLAQEKLVELDHKIHALQMMKTLLDGLVNDCPGGTDPIEECPILEHLAQYDV
ncbi:MAG: heavy metal-responsive transcriptional regulator [Phototrophicales bacterium]|nr:heavy metal-responsive transcriptional regulator [Phototrophicales bacterium]